MKKTKDAMNLKDRKEGYQESLERGKETWEIL